MAWPTHAWALGREGFTKNIDTPHDLALRRETTVHQMIAYYPTALQAPQGEYPVMHAGLYVEGMESKMEDVAALERRWLKPIYTAAPKLVLR